MEEENEEGISGGYSAAFAKLHNAALLEPEALPNVPDASRYLAESIGKYSQVLRYAVSPASAKDIVRISAEPLSNYSI